MRPVLLLLIVGLTRATMAAGTPVIGTPVEVEVHDIGRGDELVEETREALGHVGRVLAEARGEKDPLRQGCVREKQARVVALSKVAGESHAAWRGALREGRLPAARHARDRLVLTHAKVLAYRAEADQCVGSLAFSDPSGRASRQVVQWPDLPATDTLSPLTTGATDAQRPPPASPVR
jgi:hypothetical protein